MSLPLPLIERSEKEIARAVRNRVEKIKDVKYCNQVLGELQEFKKQALTEDGASQPTKARCFASFR